MIFFLSIPPVFLNPFRYPSLESRHSDLSTPILTEDGEFVRSIYESIVLKIRHYAEALKELGIIYGRINIINGAVRNSLLMQMISNALGKEVYAGMEYATLTGNLLTQLYAMGEVKTVKEMRSLSAECFSMKQYGPEEQEYWTETAEKYERIIK